MAFELIDWDDKVDVKINPLPEENKTTAASLNRVKVVVNNNAAEAAAKLTSVQPGANISVDNTDPQNPIVSSFTGTSAGIITPLFVTGEEEILPAGTFYKTLRNDKGSVASVQQIVITPDDTIEWFLQDAVSAQAITNGKIPVGTYNGFFSIQRDSTSGDAVRFGAEVYLTDADGNVTDVGVPIGNPIGSYGVRIMAFISTGNIEPTAGSETQANVTGVVPEEVPYVTGQRFRYRFFGEKVGIQGANVTLSLYFGFDHNTYLEVPVIVTTDDVFNTSLVVGATATDALNNLESNKLDKGVKEEKISGTRLTNVAVTGAQQLDWNAYKEFEFTLIGNTTLSDSLLPTGANTKVVNMYVKGDFTLLFPSYYEALPSNDSYDGTKTNLIVIDCLNGTALNEKVYYSLQNLAT